MRYTKKKLKNGLRVITAPMKGTETATVLVMVGVGSRYESETEAGLSHFIEHMMFKGTKKRPDTLNIAEELDSIGGEYNAFTSKNRTGYWAKVDATHLDTALDVVADIFLNSKLESKEIEREKGAILQELAMYEDMPMRSIEDTFENLLYGNQKLGREIIGYKKTVSAFKRKNFVDYMNKFYVANDTVVCVAGKIDEKEVIQKIEKYFSKFDGKEKPEFEKVKEDQKSPKIKIKEKKTDQTHLALGVRAYDDNHKDRYVLSVLSTILGGNMSSRMFISIRERQGLAYYVRTGAERYEDAGYLVTNSGVEHKNLSKTIESILSEYKKIASKKIENKELQKAKDYLKGTMVMGLESSDEVASFLTNQEVRKGEILTPEEIFERIDQVSIQDVLRVAKDIFKKENLNLAVIGPHENSKKFKAILDNF
ncbi:MAG: insulinase family protein [Candidatus Moranbacteria bacterium]|nr:insulinase family protein [Candidatus Moranbacteria bacterium]